MLLEIGDLFGQAVAQLMLLAFEEAGIEQAGHILDRNGSISDAAVRCFDLDERLEIEHAARAVADDFNVDLAIVRFMGDRGGDFIGADG